jgi:hypothetical protein
MGKRKQSLQLTTTPRPAEIRRAFSHNQKLNDVAHTIKGTTSTAIFDATGAEVFVRIEYDYTPEHTDRPFAGGERRGDDYETETVPEIIDVLSVQFNDGLQWVNFPLRFISARNMEYIYEAIRNNAWEKFESHEN